MLTSILSLCALASASTAAGAGAPRPGMLPQAPAEAGVQWYGYSQGPSLWGIGDPSYLRAFLDELLPETSGLDLTDPSLAEEHYERLAPYRDKTGAGRFRRVFVTRVTSATLCASGTCPWVISQVDGRERSLAEETSAAVRQARSASTLELADRHEDAMKGYAADEMRIFTGNSGDRTSKFSLLRLRDCGDGEARSSFRFAPGTVYAGRLVAIEADLSAVTLCGKRHPLTWPRG